AETLFARASTPSALADPVMARRLRNFRAMHYLNQKKLKEAIAELAKPVAEVAAVATKDTKLANGEIDPSIANDLNAEKGAAAIGGGLESGLQPFEEAQIIDAQAMMLRGAILRQQKDFTRAKEVLAQAVAAMQAVRGGNINSVSFVRTQIQNELAFIA